MDPVLASAGLEECLEERIQSEGHLVRHPSPFSGFSECYHPCYVPWTCLWESVRPHLRRQIEQSASPWLGRAERRVPPHPLSDLRRNGSLQEGVRGLGKEIAREGNLAAGRCNILLIRHHRSCPLSSSSEAPLRRNPANLHQDHCHPVEWMWLQIMAFVRGEGDSWLSRTVSREASASMHWDIKTSRSVNGGW